MTIFLPVLWLFLAAGSFSMISRRQFGYVLPVVQLSVPPVLYVSQFLLHSFTPGVWILILPAAAFLPLCFFAVKREKARIGCSGLDGVLSPGFYALFVLVCIYLVIDFKRPLTKFDELKHWGMMVKEMFRLDAFYAVPECNLLAHKDYPPFAPLLELFWCRLCGSYTEMGVSMAAHIFTMSLVMGPVSEILGVRALTVGEQKPEDGSSFFDRIREGLRSVLPVQILLALSLMIFILGLDGYHLFMTIYTDIMISAVFAYAMYLIFTEKAFQDLWGLWALTASLSALLQIKQVGIGFYLLAVFYCLLHVCNGALSDAPSETPSDAPGKWKQGLLDLKQRLLYFIVSAGIPACGIAAWKKYISAFPMDRQFDFSTFKMSDVLDIIRGSVEGSAAGQRRDTLVHFIVAVFQENVLPGAFPVTMASALLISFLVMLVLRRCFPKTFPRREYIALSLTFLCGTAGYTIMILLVYLFKMEPSEMETLKSFSRYMSSYVAAEALTLLFIGLDLGRKKLSAKMEPFSLTVLAIVLAAALCPANLLYFVPQKLHGNPRYPYRIHAEKIAGETEPGARVFMIADTHTDEYQTFISYYANEQRFTLRDLWAFGYPYRDRPELKEQVAVTMADNDYVYVIHTNQQLQEAFGDLTKDGQLKADTIYKVVKDPDSTESAAGIRLAPAKE